MKRKCLFKQTKNYNFLNLNRIISMPFSRGQKLENAV